MGVDPAEITFTTYLPVKAWVAGAFGPVPGGAAAEPDAGSSCESNCQSPTGWPLNTPGRPQPALAIGAGPGQTIEP